MASPKLITPEVLESPKLGVVKTTGKTFEQLRDDMERDKFMTPDEAVKYGLADRIVTSREDDNKADESE